MSYRYHGRARVNPSAPIAQATCARCGFHYNRTDLHWQHQWAGNSLINLNLLVCDTCLDVPQAQLRALVLPTDPDPVVNARPDFYSYYNDSDLSTESGSTLTTQTGVALALEGPIQVKPPGTANLVSSIIYPTGSVATVYLDLFSGNPAGGGMSVLSLITGSSTRTDLSSQLTTTNNIATNPSPIVISASSQATTNVRYCGIYSASSGGRLLASATVSASPTISKSYPVQFAQLGLSININ